MTQPKRYAVIGDPIHHSLSPRIQAAAFRASAIPADYFAIQVTRRNLPQWLRREARELSGFNVTVPHKSAVINFMDELDVAAVATASVNTVVCEPEHLRGYNTDVEGFNAALGLLPAMREGDSALVFGSGGAARAVMHALRQRGVSVTVVTRTPEQHLDSHTDAVGPNDQRLLAKISRAQLLVNATPLGMAHLAKRSPIPNGATAGEQTSAMDLVYGRQTPFLQWARSQGCPSIDGTEMLLAQAAAAFTIWTGIEPDLEVMRHALPTQKRQPVA